MLCRDSLWYVHCTAGMHMNHTVTDIIRDSVIIPPANKVLGSYIGLLRNHPVQMSYKNTA